MNDIDWVQEEEWGNEMRAIVNYAYGEDWMDSNVQHLWESRYNDVAKGYNELTGWLLENEPKVWHTLKPLIIEWTKEYVWGPDYYDEEEVDQDGKETGLSIIQGFEKYKNEVKQ